MLTGRRVLVIEDEMLILMMIEDMLVDLGCESVTSAATIDQAIALIDAQVFDAAMLDMNLNGKNSRAVADPPATAFTMFGTATTAMPSSGNRSAMTTSSLCLHVFSLRMALPFRVFPDDSRTYWSPLRVIATEPHKII